MNARRLFAWALASMLLAIPAAAQSTRAGASAAAFLPTGLFPAPQGTVGIGEAYTLVARVSDPSACSEGNVEFNLTSATPKYCSAANTWTPFAIGGSGGASGTVNSGTQFAFGEFAASGTAISSGPAPPTSDGEYFCGYNVTASAAVAPACWLNALTPRAVTGTTSADTVLYNDAIIEYKGSVAVATALPAPATLGDSGFYVRLVNNTSGSATAVTVTAAGSYTFSSTGSATLVVAQGQSCSLLVDPAGSVWDDTCGDLPWTAGTNITIARGPFGATISASGGGVSSFSGDGALATNSASTGAVTLALHTAGAHQWWGNNTGSTAAPGYESLGYADIPNNAANTTGNAATATALAATPTQCSGAQFAKGIAASGNANCATPAGATFTAATATLFDDFMSNNALSVLGWVANGGGGSVSMQPTGAGQRFTNHPGMVQLSSGSSSGDWEYYILGNQNNPEVDPAANTFSIYADLTNNSISSSDYEGTIRFGVFDSTSMNQKTPNTAAYFEEDGTGTSTAPNWNCVISNSGTATSVSAGVTAAYTSTGSGTFHVLEISFNATTTPAFYIDGAQVCGSLSATMTRSVLQSIAWESVYNTGAAGALIDYAQITWNLTR